MPKVAANEPPREKCSGCETKVIRARNVSNRTTVFVEEVSAGFGRVGLELDLTGGLPTLIPKMRGTRFRLHRCKSLSVSL